MPLLARNPNDVGGFSKPSFGGTFAGRFKRGIIVSKSFLQRLPFHIHNGLFQSPKQKQVVRPVVSQSVDQGSYL